MSQAPAPALKNSPRDVVSDRFVRRGVVTFEQSPGLAVGLPRTVTRSQVSSLVLSLPHGTSVWVALDEHPARRVGARRLHLSDLLNEDEELAPGFHHLVVFKEESADKMLLALHAFSLDVESEAAPQAPPCVLFTPQLTLNGPLASDSLTVLAIPLVPDVDRIRMQANGPDFASEAIVPVGTAVGLSTPQSGDFVFSAACLSGSDVMLEIERAVTVNRDADWGAQTK